MPKAKSVAAKPVAAVSKVASLLSVDDVAEVLKLSRSTIYRLLDRKEIPSPIKIGGQNRWRPEAISNWIDSGCARVD